MAVPPVTAERRPSSGAAAVGGRGPAGRLRRPPPRWVGFSWPRGHRGARRARRGRRAVGNGLVSGYAGILPQAGRWEQARPSSGTPCGGPEAVCGCGPDARDRDVPEAAPARCRVRTLGLLRSWSCGACLGRWFRAFPLERCAEAGSLHPPGTCSPGPGPGPLHFSQLPGHLLPWEPPA